jgi:predicted O-methyltransferase YrrM
MRAAPGFLTEREGRFLALAAAAAPAAGVILEIGSFMGKSTVGLAAVARRTGQEPVVTVDPHSAPAPTDPDLEGAASSWDAFHATVRGAGVSAFVAAHRAFSRDLAREWQRPIRLLWIDGDHTYAGAREDFALFAPHLAPGAIIALHDVLHSYEGPLRVFIELVLASDAFGPAGVCGSIGWAQFRPGAGQAYAGERARLAGRARRLVPFVKDGRRPTGARRLLYQLWRARVPHAAPIPAEWAARVVYLGHA